MVPNIVDLVPMYCDNNEAIVQAKGPRSHQRSKHVLRRYHLIREIIGRCDVIIEKVPTDHNIYDPLTMLLPQKKFDSHVLCPMVVDIKAIGFRSSGRLLEKCSKGHRL